MRDESEINRAVEEYADMVRRVCFYHLKNREDTEDVFQNVFLKYMLCDKPFKDREHEKAWLLRVAINACKDYVKSFFRRNAIPLETLREMEAGGMEEHREMIDVIENRNFSAIEPLLKRHLYGGVRRMGGNLFSEEYRKFFSA